MFSSLNLSFDEKVIGGVKLLLGNTVATTTTVGILGSEA
jgi:hypothetical protein